MQMDGKKPEKSFHYVKAPRAYKNDASILKTEYSELPTCDAYDKKQNRYHVSPVISYSMPRAPQL